MYCSNYGLHDTQRLDFLLKNNFLTFLTYYLFKDEKYFKDPEAFIPERFLNENQSSRHAYSYIPFSAGKRNCIGQKFALMEEKVMLASILRKFKITAMQKRDELEEDFEIILRSKNGIIVNLEPRVFFE